MSVNLEAENKTTNYAATSGAGTAHPSGAPKFTPGF